MYCSRSPYFGISFTVCLLLLLASGPHARGQNPESRTYRSEGYIPLKDINHPAEIQKLIDSNRAFQHTVSDTGLQLYQYTLAQSKRLGYRYGMAASLLILGKIYDNKGMTDHALNAYLQLIEVCKKDTRSRKFLATAYCNAAIVYRNWGYPEQATEMSLLAIEAVEQNPQSVLSVANIYLNLSNVMADEQLKLDYLHKADAAARKSGDYDILSKILLSKAGRYIAKKNFDSAWYYINETLQLGNNTGDSTIRYYGRILSSKLALGTKQPVKALEWYKRAQEVNPKNNATLNDRDQEELLLGEIYLQLKKYNDAEVHIRSALSRAYEFNIKKTVADAMRHLAYIYYNTGEYREAYEWQIRYQKVNDSLMNESIARNIHQLDAKYKAAEKDKKLTIQQHQLERKNMLLVGIGIIVLLSGIVTLLLWRNRQRRQKQQQEIALLRGIIAGEEQERGRLARELHDGIGGMLAAIKMNVGSALKEQPEAAQSAGIPVIEHMLQDTASEVRKAAHNLIPDVLTRYNLQEAIAHYCQQVSAGKSLQVDLQCRGDLSVLNKSTELMLYRMIQELIQNVIKHAKATRAEVQVLRHDNELFISVTDNGKGFDPAMAQHGFGLENLSFRVRALQGTITIISSEEGSTTIHIEFDLDKLSKGLG